MGCFNSIYVSCNDCGHKVEFQSKSGDCSMSHYSISNMPIIDLAGIIGDIEACTNCGNLLRIGEPPETMKYGNFLELVE